MRIRKKVLPMMWAWQDADQQVDLADLGGVGFASQEEAEAWLSEAYPDVAEAGVTAVNLCQDGRLVYGPMSLSD